VKPGSVRNVETQLIGKDKIYKDTVHITWRPPETGGKPKGYIIKCGDIEEYLTSNVSIVVGSEGFKPLCFL